MVGLVGWVLRDRISMRMVIAASVAGSIVFFLVSNFGVWAAGVLYPDNVAGLAECYTAGIPFFRNTVVGDLFYAALIFGSYEIIRHRRMATARA